MTEFVTPCYKTTEHDRHAWGGGVDAYICPGVHDDWQIVEPSTDVKKPNQFTFKASSELVADSEGLHLLQESLGDFIQKFHDDLNKELEAYIKWACATTGLTVEELGQRYYLEMSHDHPEVNARIDPNHFDDNKIILRQQYRLKARPVAP